MHYMGDFGLDGMRNTCKNNSKDWYSGYLMGARVDLHNKALPIRYRALLSRPKSCVIT